MGLFDFPILVMRFPPDQEDPAQVIQVEIDVTGDIQLNFPIDEENSVASLRSFSDFLSGIRQKNFLALLKEFSGFWRNPIGLMEWKRYQKRFKSECNASLASWAGPLEEFFQNSFDFISHNSHPDDTRFLEVTTKFIDAVEPILTTLIDQQGDFVQMISPKLLHRNDLLEGHIKGVELSLFIKTAISDFLVKLFKRLIFLI